MGRRWGCECRPGWAEACGREAAIRELINQCPTRLKGTAVNPRLLPERDRLSSGLLVIRICCRIIEKCWPERLILNRTLPQNTAKMLMSLQQTDYCGHVW